MGVNKMKKMFIGTAFLILVIAGINCVVSFMTQFSGHETWWVEVFIISNIVIIVVANVLLFIWRGTKTALVFSVLLIAFSALAFFYYTATTPRYARDPLVFSSLSLAYCVFTLVQLFLSSKKKRVV